MNLRNGLHWSPRALLLVAMALALSLSLVSLAIALAGSSSPSQGQYNFEVYLPLIVKSPPPVGSYFCNEYENGLIWTQDVITLNADGTSIYEYYPPYSGIATGTWVYTPATQEVGFTNFRWLTATYEAPGRLWARRYLPESRYEIALDCGRRE